VEHSTGLTASLGLVRGLLTASDRSQEAGLDHPVARFRQAADFFWPSLLHLFL